MPSSSTFTTTRNCFNRINNDFTGPVATGEYNFNDFTVHTRSEAIYGQAEYDLSSKLTAILGARYTWDQLRINVFDECIETNPGACEALYLAGPAAGSNTVIGFGPTSQPAKDHDWSGKAQLNFKPVDDVLLYASASKGLKGAGFTAPLGALPAGTKLAYLPEKLYAFEIGEKAQFLNHKLTVNSDVYYYDYKDLQSFLFTGITTAVINRNAHAYGGEFETYRTANIDSDCERWCRLQSLLDQERAIRGWRPAPEQRSEAHAVLERRKELQAL